MGRHYSTRDFFREMPNRLLARYFEAHGVLAELDFASMKETQTEGLFAAWRELPEGQRNAMDAELREIHALSCEKGWCAIRDEAQWQFKVEPERTWGAVNSQVPSEVFGGEGPQLAWGEESAKRSGRVCAAAAGRERS
jgi:hypothetical protein